MNADKEAFYQRLKEELANTSLWPTLYLYKFIVPTDKQKIETVQNAFDNMGAVINTKKSAKGNYTSVSIQVVMNNPDHVIAKYQELSTVEGILSL